MPGPDSIVISWAKRWPEGVDGIWTVEGITVDQYNALVWALEDKRPGIVINVLKAAGYKVEWIPKPESA